MRRHIEMILNALKEDIDAEADTQVGNCQSREQQRLLSFMR